MRMSHREAARRRLARSTRHVVAQQRGETIAQQRANHHACVRARVIYWLAIATLFVSFSVALELARGARP